MDRPAAGAGGIRLKMHRAGLRIECRVFEGNCLRTRIYRSGKHLPVPLEFNRHIISISGAGPPISGPSAAERIAPLARQEGHRYYRTDHEASHVDPDVSHLSSV